MSLHDTPSISGVFKDAAEHNALARKRGTPPPFSLRLTASEKATLLRQARGMPLGAYIRSRLLKGSESPRQESRRPAVEDKLLAQLLAELGNARLANNLNQLAKSANLGTLPVTPDTEEALQAACQDVQRMRNILMRALGLRPGGPS
jgi:hypothetical protein